MNDATQPVTLKPDGEMLRGFWYPALRSTRVPSRRLTKAMLLEVPLVLGRDVLMRSTWGLHFYTGMLVIEKRPIEPPEALEAGEPLIQNIPPHPSRPKPLHRRLLRAIWPRPN